MALCSIGTWSGLGGSSGALFSGSSRTKVLPTPLTCGGVESGSISRYLLVT